MWGGYQNNDGNWVGGTWVEENNPGPGCLSFRNVGLLLILGFGAWGGVWLYNHVDNPFAGEDVVPLALPRSGVWRGTAQSASGKAVEIQLAFTGGASVEIAGLGAPCDGERHVRSLSSSWRMDVEQGSACTEYERILVEPSGESAAHITAYPAAGGPSLEGQIAR
mgnify:CR=1 FL=1